MTPTFSASETSSGRRMTGNDPEPPTVATAAESADCAGCPDENGQTRADAGPERVLERSGEAPVYGPNLRASCRRLEDAGWLRTLRAPNLQLAVELTDAGRAVAQPLLLAEQDRIRAEQRAAEVVVLPLVPAAGLPADGTSATDLAVQLNGITYQACRGDFVVRLDGSTCLQLWNKEGRVVRLEGDPLEVAQWLQACHDAGIEVRVQINESSAP